MDGTGISVRESFKLPALLRDFIAPAKLRQHRCSKIARSRVESAKVRALYMQELYGPHSRKTSTNNNDIHDCKLGMLLLRVMGLYHEGVPKLPWVSVSAAAALQWQAIAAHRTERHAARPLPSLQVKRIAPRLSKLLA